MFSVNDIVWAKSTVRNEIFWPSKVVEPDSDIYFNPKNKNPVVAYVRFLVENTYEAIKNRSDIAPFNCDSKRKDVFLLKGHNLRNEKRRRQFEKAVQKAEKWSEKKACSEEVVSNNAHVNGSLETTSKRCESARGEIILKRSRSNIERNDGKDSTDGQETKRPRRASCEEENTSTESCTAKGNEELTNQNLGLNTPNCPHQNETKDVSDSSYVENNGILKAAQSTVETKESLNADEASSCRNGFGHADLDELQTKGSCDDSGVANEKTGDMLRNDENKEMLESLIEKKGSTDARGDGSDVEDREKDVCICEDESLPEVFSPGAKKNFMPGDVVWVKHMNFPFWPAQITEVTRCGEKHGQETQFYVKFLPKSECKGIIVPEENIKKFNEDYETFLQYKNLRKEFEEAVEQAGDILKRQEGTSDASASDVSTSVNETKTDKERTTEKQERPQKDSFEIIEEAKSTGSCVTKTDEELTNDNLGLYTENSSPQNKTKDISESLCIESQGIMNAAESHAETTQSLDATSSFLDSVGASLCSNGLGPADLDELQAKGSCDDSGVANEKTGDMLRNDENKNIFESLIEKEGSSDVRSDDSYVKDNEKDVCSSDDESLPDVFSPAPKKNFMPGDLVWVKHMKWPVWPAQISRGSNKNKSYFYVKFLPKSECKGVRINKKNIKSFTENHETFLQYKNQKVDSKVREEFEDAVDEAEEILRRRAFPKEDVLPSGIQD